MSSSPVVSALRVLAVMSSITLAGVYVVSKSGDTAKPGPTVTPGLSGKGQNNTRPDLLPGSKSRAVDIDVPADLSLPRQPPTYLPGSKSTAISVDTPFSLTEETSPVFDEAEEPVIEFFPGSKSAPVELEALPGSKSGRIDVLPGSKSFVVEGLMPQETQTSEAAPTDQAAPKEPKR